MLESYLVSFFLFGELLLLGGENLNTKKAINLVEGLIRRTEALEFMNEEERQDIYEEAKMLIRNIFTVHSEYLRSVKSVIFHSAVLPSSEEADRYMWESGKSEYLSIFKAMKRELELFGDGKNEDDEIEINESQSIIDINQKNVFIVHGHDEALKQTVARTVDQLGLNAIILSEQDDGGHTVIEKFEVHANDCKFAIILLSPDDVGYKRSDQPDPPKFRARQNVILELGYFMGRLGRKNVIAIVKDDPSGQLEIPSDIAGFMYTEYDHTEGWKLKLVRRLKECGYDVSADDL